MTKNSEEIDNFSQEEQDYNKKQQNDNMNQDEQDTDNKNTITEQEEDMELVEIEIKQNDLIQSEQLSLQNSYKVKVLRLIFITLSFIAFFIITMVYSNKFTNKIQDFYDFYGYSETGIQQIKDQFQEYDIGTANIRLFLVDLNVIKRITQYYYIGCIASMSLVVIHNIFGQVFKQFFKTKKAIKIITTIVVSGTIISFIAWQAAASDILNYTYTLDIDQDTNLSGDVGVINGYFSQEFIGFWGYSFSNWQKAQKFLGAYPEFKMANELQITVNNMTSVPYFIILTLSISILSWAISEILLNKYLEKQKYKKIQNLLLIDDLKNKEEIIKEGSNQDIPELNDQKSLTKKPQNIEIISQNKEIDLNIINNNDIILNNNQEKLPETITQKNLKNTIQKQVLYRSQSLFYKNNKEDNDDDKIKKLNQSFY